VDATDIGFQDDLLDHLVGKWNVTSIAHGDLSNAVIEGEVFLEMKLVRQTHWQKHKRTTEGFVHNVY